MIMKAMIFAAGLGTRLRPLTDNTPKALICVAGRPMLEHIIMKLKMSGFTEIVVNIHYLGQQIIDFLNANDKFGLTIHISDERDRLLDTGGGIKKAAAFFRGEEPFLVHNVDILSNTDLRKLYLHHSEEKNDATLLVSERETSRYLLFENDRLQGWINRKTGETKPKGFSYIEGKYREYAFSGIHVLSPSIFHYMESMQTDKFSIIDFYLKNCREATLKGYTDNNLRLIDIGKPETLAQAEKFVNTMKQHCRYCSSDPTSKHRSADLKWHE